MADKSNQDANKVVCDKDKEVCTQGRHEDGSDEAMEAILRDHPKEGGTVADDGPGRSGRTGEMSGISQPPYP